MNIIIANTLYAPSTVGGAEKSVQTLAEGFVANGHQVVVLCLSETYNTYTINNVKIISLKLKNIYWPFKDNSKSSIQKLKWHHKDVKNKAYDNMLKKIFEEYKPDILFTNNLTGFSTHIWRIAYSLNIKIVHTLRDYYLQCPKTVKFKNNSNCIKSCLDCKYLSKEKKESSQLVNYVVGISKFILKDHIKNKYFQEAYKKVIFNGFELQNTEKKNTDRASITFGFIGQLVPSKGIELLLKSFRNLEMFDWKLLIAGKSDKNYINYLKALNKSNNIEFLGYIESVSFFRRIDVLIVPSLWNEPFGRVVIESISQKTPVIASSRGGLIELLNNNKNFLFEPQEEILHNFIKRILSNNSILGEFIFDLNYLENFSSKLIIQKYINVFEEVTSNA